MIPVEALDQHVAICGVSGSGKTFAAKGAVEHLLGLGRQVIVIDPTSVWWGLRVAADGKGAGFPVAVFGGERADVAIDDEAGPRLADLLIERGISAVIDVGEMTMGARRRLVTGLLERLYHKSRKPLHLVVDEADDVAPQRPLPDQTVMLHRLDQIVRRGRARGFRCMLITQRPAVLHKDVLSQAQTLVAMKLTAPQDRNAIGAWIEGQADREAGRALLAALPKLAVGSGWVWWPAGGVLREEAFQAITTFDSSRTPEHGDPEPVVPGAGAAIDVGALVAAMGVPGRADETPGQPGVGGLTKADVDAAYQRGLTEGFTQGCNNFHGFWQQMRAAVMGSQQHLHAMEKALDLAKFRVQGPARPEVTSQGVVGEPRAMPPPASGGGGTPKGAERRILSVLAAAGRPLTRRQWATMAGMSASSGTFSNYLSRLRGQGAIVETEAGFSVAPGVAVMPGAPASAAALRETWKTTKLLRGGPARMIDALAAAGSDGMDRANLAERVGMVATSGTYTNYLSRLRVNGLVEVVRRRVTLVSELLG
jgi:hypothetical protein